MHSTRLDSSIRDGDATCTFLLYSSWFTGFLGNSAVGIFISTEGTESHLVVMKEKNMSVVAKSHCHVPLHVDS